MIITVSWHYQSLHDFTGLSSKIQHSLPQPINRNLAVFLANLNPDELAAQFLGGNCCCPAAKELGRG